MSDHGLHDVASQTNAPAQREAHRGETSLRAGAELAKSEDELAAALSAARSVIDY